MKRQLKKKECYHLGQKWNVKVSSRKDCSPRDRKDTNVKISGETVADVILNVKEIVNNFFWFEAINTQLYLQSAAHISKHAETLVIEVDFESWQCILARGSFGKLFWVEK